MTSQAREIGEGLLDLVYPPKCVICGDFGPAYICASCVADLKPVSRPFCPTCGHPMPGNDCRLCAERPRSFIAARAAGEYGGVLRDAIHEFKYKGGRFLAEPLARFLHSYLTTACDVPWRRAECIVPVPIHPIRKRLRGYNQSELLADSLSLLTGLPVARDAVIRTRYTRPQVELSREDRQRNMRGAFAARDGDDIRKRMVLLVDDVATTCSTIHECSQAILAAGAAGAYVACLAFGA